MRVQFGSFRLDNKRCELTRDGESIHLTPKAFDLLTHLVNQSPNAVSQKDLYDHLWPDSLVDTSRIHQLIQEIRAALADDERRVIRTVYGRGYSFVESAIRLDTEFSSLCRLAIGAEHFDLQEGANLVGRDYAARVRIESSCVSRRHAAIVVDHNSATITDLRSRNGTFIEGRRVRSIMPLSHGALIAFACVVASFTVLTAPSETAEVAAEVAGATHSLFQ